MQSENLLYKNIGRKINYYRKQQNMTQAALSISVGLKRSSIAHIEKGVQKIPLDKLYKVARTLHRTIFDLIPGSYQESSFDEISMKRLSDSEKEEVLKKIRE